MINGKPVADLLVRAHKQISGDNEIFKNDKLSNKLQIKVCRSSSLILSLSLLSQPKRFHSITKSLIR